MHTCRLAFMHLHTCLACIHAWLHASRLACLLVWLQACMDKFLTFCLLGYYLITSWGHKGCRKILNSAINMRPTSTSRKEWISNISCQLRKLQPFPAQISWRILLYLEAFPDNNLAKDQGTVAMLEIRNQVFWWLKMLCFTESTHIICIVYIICYLILKYIYPIK